MGVQNRAFFCFYNMSQRRIYQNDYPYLLTTNLKHREWFLNDQRIASILAKNIFERRDHYQAELYGYCIMPNHLHILSEFMSEHDVSDFMHDLKSISATEIRKNVGLNIKLWKKRFYDQVVSDKNRFFRTKNYLIANHEKWDLSDRYAKYPYLYIDNKLFNVRYCKF